MQIAAGTPIQARTALGDEIERIAASGVVEGSDFLVVWICEPQEWAAAKIEGRNPDAVPWPAEAVHPALGVAPAQT